MALRGAIENRNVPVLILKRHLFDFLRLEESEKLIVCLRIINTV